MSSIGRCTEYNESGRIIQQQVKSLCDKTGLPKCAEPYNSSLSYKCKNLVLTLIN